MLPVLGQPVRERADAARNRAKIFAAASELFRGKGVGAVSMDEIAAAAGVGKGTLFRRFGDKRGLVIALLDERERDLQGRILGGDPPLGPGSEPVERLVALGASVVEEHQIPGFAWTVLRDPEGNEFCVGG